jgi:hypothetical protein
LLIVSYKYSRKLFLLQIYESIYQKANKVINILIFGQQKTQLMSEKSWVLCVNCQETTPGNLFKQTKKPEIYNIAKISLSPLNKYRQKKKNYKVLQKYFLGLW